MKILNIIFILLLGITIPKTEKLSTSSPDYTTYSSINLSRGKLISNWTLREKEAYLKKVNKRKFWGWNVEIVNQEVEATFESEILFSFYNTGPTEIEYTKTISYYKSTRTSISCNGSITYKTTGTIKKFKHNLDSSVNIKYESNDNIEEKEVDTLKIKIDPGYKAILYMVGTAKVTNGYAQRYIFWCKQNSGAFEYFTITNQYPRIKKVKI